jgi:hypothetical protein
MLKLGFKAITAGMILLFSLAAQGQDLCTRQHKKPVLSLEQMIQSELVDVLCEIAGMKELPEWPEDITAMTPEQYYTMEVDLLVNNGYPPSFMEIEPGRLVNRRFFASLMFYIAMQVDDEFQKDCKDAIAETDQLECLFRHGYIYMKEATIYKDEILDILCSKELIVPPEAPPPRIEQIEIYPEEFMEATIESPGSPSE